MRIRSTWCVIPLLLLVTSIPVSAQEQDDYGLDVVVELLAPGCTGGGALDGGKLHIENANRGVWLWVGWHGFADPNNPDSNLRFYVENAEGQALRSRRSL